MTRALLIAATIGTLTGLALTFGPHGAIGIAVCAAGVIAWYLVRAVRRDKQRARDKARHPSNAPWCTFHAGDGYTLAHSVTYRPARAVSVIKGGKRRRWWR